LGQKKRDFQGDRGKIRFTGALSAGTFMRMVIVTQLLAALIVIVLSGLFAGWPDTRSALYGAALGMVITMLTKRSTDRTLQTAVDNPRYGAISMFSGFALKYAVAVLGLLAGLVALRLPATPMISAFILMILVQALSSLWIRDLK